VNYYIDFDNTLYNTALLTDRMLNLIVNSILEKHKDFLEEELKKECKMMFNRENIYDIYKLINYFANKYNIDEINTKNKINNLILNSGDLVYKDVFLFLSYLKNNHHKLYLLSYCDNLSYQSLKIIGAKLDEFFDAIYITSIPKHLLDINYANGIFIDDNPRDLLGLYKQNAKSVIRIRRNTNKYSKENLDINIEEYPDLEKLYVKIKEK